RYISDQSDETKGEKSLKLLLEAISNEDKRRLIMTYSDKLRQEGRQEGIKTRSLEIAKNMLLNLHLGIDVVQKATGLSTEELKKLQVSR
ncbi:MAG: hypothetical protein MI674_08105, partial [Cytophagales bacterium]|nr:hypothetical protein [Cytophagales bacterium]